MMKVIVGFQTLVIIGLGALLFAWTDVVNEQNSRLNVVEATIDRLAAADVGFAPHWRDQQARLRREGVFTAGN